MHDSRHTSTESSLPFSLLERVDRAGDRFEDAWAAGPPPAIETYLADSREPERAILLRELLGLELVFRRRAGETPSPTEYLSRFPEHAAVIHEVFAETPAEAACLENPEAGNRATPPERSSVSGGERPSEAGSGMTSGQATAPETSEAAAGERPVVPGYEILGELGKGGMGIVYRARHLRLEREVALKMIRAGAQASPEELACFRTEAALQARVQHPHIVQIFEVGDVAGAPYFALEYVDGPSLDKQIAGTPQSPQGAAALVETLARTVHHAHERGLVHRDLKPANILLSADGTPKIGDFGLAKSLQGEARQTQSGTVVGTPSYMAPEQAWGLLKVIGPAADVYALGAILYELMTGRPPFLGSTPLDTVLQVRHHEPVPPRRWLDQVPWELEVICLKCLHKDREQRYASALALADDLGRFLNGEPIQARSTPAWEKALKWIKRKPAAAALIGVSALALLTLFGVVLGFTLELRAALKATQQERDRAEDREQEANLAREEEARQRTTAERERAVAQAVNDFLHDLLGQADVANQPLLADRAERNPNITVRELLDRAAAGLEVRFREQPEVEAAVRQTIGDAYHEIGSHDKAQEQLDRVVAWRRQHLGADHPDTLTSLNSLAMLYMSRGQPDKAELLYQEALAGRRLRLGPDHPATLSSLANLAILYMSRGRYNEAEPLFQEGLAGCRRKLGADHSHTLANLANLATLYMHWSRYGEAEPLFEEALAGWRRTLGGDHPQTLASLNNLATLYRCSSQYDKAEPLFQEALAGCRRTRGADHRETLTCLNGLAILYMSSGRHEKAEPLFQEALAGCRRTLGADHPTTLTSLHGLALLYYSLHRYDEAEPLYKEALAWCQRQLDPGHPDRLMCLNNLAMLYRDRGQYKEAEPLFLEAVSQAKQKFGLAHSTTQGLIRNTAIMYEQADRPEKAEPLWRELVDAAKQKPGPESPLYATWLASLAGNLLKQHEPAEAEPLLRTCLTIRRQKEPDAWTTFNTQSLLGEALAGQRKYAEAEPLLKAGYEGLQAREKTIPPQAKAQLTKAVERLVQLYDAWGKPEQAKTWRKQLDQAKAPAREANQ